MSETPLRNGGQILVDALLQHAVDTVYCIPGESYLPVLDALHDARSIRTIVTRHEGAASNMADAYGKLSGRPGICFVTRGPGATHAANGVHTAMQDSTPMILFIGQVESAFKGREAFQEVDYRQMFGSLAKWTTEIDDIRRIPEIVARAFAVAQSGRPGPVVIGLPEEVLFGTATVADCAPARTIASAPADAALAELRERLARAERPLLIVGGTGWNAEACKALQRFAAANGLPVAASFRRQDLFDNRDEHYVGQLGFGASPRLTERVRDADLLLVLGSRLSETPTAGYTLVESPQPRQALIHVHADASELGRVYRADLPIQAGMPQIAAALADLEPLAERPWAQWTSTARADYLAYSTAAQTPVPLDGVDLAQVVHHLSQTLPDDAVISNGAGNYAVWVHRFYRYRSPRSQLAPTNGAMGYGFPAAIAAKLRDPDRSVVCFAGDGCFMMYPQELATAVQFGAALIVIVVNNGMLGTIRMHQEREYPGRISATALHNPDFVALARAFGAHGELVERTEDFAAAFLRAQASGMPALIELRTDPRQITPQARLN
ncbi:thiamine pyrophosphate-binding protein [Pseudomonas sp. ZM23]|uniref:Thiamine pyrophosphate-binding protein n=1 Tax=Pseudomonas triclosanedens TaxID=2961893 RepID=A0ABY6ZUH6_9PSED|nr:thiamine pyrophosphate-binding protein [Pseudomonas triclosanedens]MCP8463359.1 thiamine pyrophosphate-binding protein [Pseudomonas triclosanedens]MCP8469582.1 thiamine pyrophosphate-binding protein [Pseudomonas triclosanedens]MCP8474160.1 thiamine pyrophosphate-binding protein [Pseudomonas triclosanedens]WAI48449.1 thiamine pyrophosphate-binding protein [Pseudomonas triclosanedens]